MGVPRTGQEADAHSNVGAAGAGGFGNHGNRQRVGGTVWVPEGPGGGKRGGRAENELGRGASVRGRSLDLAIGHCPRGRSAGPETDLVRRRGDAAPQPSPDEKKLVYMSGGTDRSEIWVSNLDGSSPHKLTDMGRCGTPRWSPDSRWIAFDSDGRTGQAGIYVISPEGGQPQPVVVDEWNNMARSWSRDGKWSYFASGSANDSEETEVWKVSFPGGQFVQLTRRGGFSGLECLAG